jgi:hypothetical protein
MVGNIYVVGGPQVISGVITATSFSGSGANLTSLPAQATIANNADNRVITGGSGVNLNGESNLFFNGSQLGVNVTPDSGVHLHVQNSGEANMILEGDVNGVGGYLMLKNNNTTANTSMAIQFLDGGGQGTSEIKGIYADNSNNEGHLAFSTRPSGGSTTERLRITSNGDLLLGGHSAYTYDDTGASNVILDIYGGATAGKRGILSLSGRTGSNNADLGTIWFNNDNNSGASPGNNMKLAAAIQAKSVTSDNNAQNDSGAYLQFFTKPESSSVVERMRVTQNANGTGALYINQTSEVSGANSHLVVNNSVAVVSGSTFRSMYMSGNGNIYWYNGSNQAYLSSSGNWTNASDVSLKKDITDLTYGIDVLKNLKPRKYKMKADDKEQIGFIAQEVEADVPEVVDASETPNGDQHKGLAYGNLTAVLTKALQEAVTKIETLEAKVAALEGS